MGYTQAYKVAMAAGWDWLIKNPGDWQGASVCFNKVMASQGYDNLAPTLQDNTQGLQD